MKLETTHISGVHILHPEAFVDGRGTFNRVFCRQELEAICSDLVIEQINHSVTRQKGCVRGMHFQHAPHAEIKIVKCIKGSIFDVAVDLRQGSPTLLQWCGVVLSAENMKALLIPKGCAHGFQTLEDEIELIYMSTVAYCPEAEGGIRYDDPLPAIAWPESVSMVSSKDGSQPFLQANFSGIKVY